MGKYPRPKQARLAEKLLQIRTALKFSQNEMLRRVYSCCRGSLVQRSFQRAKFVSREIDKLWFPCHARRVQEASVFLQELLLHSTSSLWVTEQTTNILNLRTPAIAGLLLADCRTLKKARYLRRWARRLRGFDFSPEDAVVIAYGSFGIAEDLTQIGAEMIVTTDLKLAARYEENFSNIEQRFQDMVSALPAADTALTLPRVMTTADVLSKL